MSAYEALRQAAEQGGSEILERLATELHTSGQYALLFEARLMAQRHALGLPLLGDLADRELPAASRESLERGYSDACREIGECYLADGDPVSAWPFLRLIQDRQSLRRALEAWAVSPTRSDNLEGHLDLALGQGLAPVLGFAVLLEERGVCDALHTLEQGFPATRDERRACLAALTRRLHEDVRRAVVSAIETHGAAIETNGGQPTPEPSRLIDLLQGRRWLFRDTDCHGDESHLMGTIRLSLDQVEPEALDLLQDLCVYGMHLPGRDQLADAPPFEDFYNDHRIYFRTLRGESVEEGIAYFEQRLARARESQLTHRPAEVLTHLLYRSDRAPEAIEVFRKYLGHSPRLHLCPTLPELCKAAGDFTALLESSEQAGHLLQYALGLFEQWRAGQR